MFLNELTVTFESYNIATVTEERHFEQLACSRRPRRGCLSTLKTDSGIKKIGNFIRFVRRLSIRPMGEILYNNFKHAKSVCRNVV